MRYIDIEAKKNAKVSTDVDNFRSRYVDADDFNFVIFPGFELTSIEKNLFVLYNDAIKVPFSQRWEMRPDYVSYDYYGTTIFWWLILYLNKIDSIEEFIGLKDIIVPNITTIQSLVRDKIPRSEFNEKPNEVITNRYYKRYPLDDVEMQTIEAREILQDTLVPTPTECILKENTEEFTLTDVDISNKYVDLEYAPVNYSSITLQIDGYTSVQSYGYDYSLKYVTNSTDLLRISWSADDITLGEGMEDLLSSGDTLIITYIYAEKNCQPCCLNNVGECVDGGVYS